MSSPVVVSSNVSAKLIDAKKRAMLDTRNQLITDVVLGFKVIGAQAYAAPVCVRSVIERVAAVVSWGTSKESFISEPACTFGLGDI